MTNSRKHNDPSPNIVGYCARAHWEKKGPKQAARRKSALRDGLQTDSVAGENPAIGQHLARNFHWRGSLESWNCQAGIVLELLSMIGMLAAAGNTVVPPAEASKAMQVLLAREFEEVGAFGGEEGFVGGDDGFAGFKGAFDKDAGAADEFNDDVAGGIVDGGGGVSGRGKLVGVGG